MMDDETKQVLHGTTSDKLRAINDNCTILNDRVNQVLDSVMIDIAESRAAMMAEIERKDGLAYTFAYNAGRLESSDYVEGRTDGRQAGRNEILGLSVAEFIQAKQLFGFDVTETVGDLTNVVNLRGDK